ncbi:hypothetical protein KsCSTR_30750 [Candidatus Kuenenia stuttgartiensis]|uniref:Uncharacterized protein n=1 Tax=Kuenenia stuttgartiensis TaxID=174633 RepID=A0A6G7GSX6_KUEST|nr:hypothetical protein KsCSTR_30750 [Candidatus Kuenenia stuttgartiensis]
MHKKDSFRSDTTYEKFKNKCLSFFKNINEYTDELSTLLTENFQIIGEQISKI